MLSEESSVNSPTLPTNKQEESNRMKTEFPPHQSVNWTKQARINNHQSPTSVHFPNETLRNNFLLYHPNLSFPIYYPTPTRTAMKDLVARNFESNSTKTAKIYSDSSFEPSDANRKILPSAATILSHPSPFERHDYHNPNTESWQVKHDLSGAANKDRIIAENHCEESLSSASSVGSQNDNDEKIKINNIKAKDVLFGRGGMTNNHPGNKIYRELVKQNQLIYLKASRRAEKTLISKHIVDTIRHNGGRFLKKADKEGERYYQEVDIKKAVAKTSQALREDAKVIRQHYDSNIVVVKVDDVIQQTDTNAIMVPPCSKRKRKRSSMDLSYNLGEERRQLPMKKQLCKDYNIRCNERWF